MIINGFRTSLAWSSPDVGMSSSPSSLRISFPRHRHLGRPRTRRHWCWVGSDNGDGDGDDGDHFDLDVFEARFAIRTTRFGRRYSIIIGPRALESEGWDSSRAGPRTAYSTRGSLGFFSPSPTRCIICSTGATNRPREGSRRSNVRWRRWKERMCGERVRTGGRRAPTPTRMRSIGSRRSD
jgi:hypothetical protein